MVIQTKAHLQSMIMPRKATFMTFNSKTPLSNNGNIQLVKVTELTRSGEIKFNYKYDQWNKINKKWPINYGKWQWIKELIMNYHASN